MDGSFTLLIASSNDLLTSEIESKVVAEFHWRTKIAPTFRIALAEIRIRAFDCAIIDRDLDGGDGIVIAPIVKERNHQCRTVLLNDHQRWATTEAAKVLGFDAVLDRNLQIADLMAEISLLQSRKPDMNSGLIELLTHREREILSYIATGRRTNEIAMLRSISEATVKSHLNSIYRKLNVRNRVEAITLLNKN
jgi:two-component system nitrate/nitrite response regulator NarL